jgi:hypothetical protein
MDKGPHPAACVRFAREQGLLSILGNHEERHLKWRRNTAREKTDPTYKNQMRPMKPADALQNSLLSDEDVAWLQGLPYYIQVAPGFVAVHGGLFKGIPLEEQPHDKIVRARWVDEMGDHVPTDYDSDVAKPPGAYHWTALYDGQDRVIYGHEAHSLTTPRIDISPSGAHCFGIDTGCVHGGRLTAMIIDDELNVTFVQVQARRKYMDPLWEIPARSR